jgi:hypothetical protein
MKETYNVKNVEDEDKKRIGQIINPRTTTKSPWIQNFLQVLPKR